MSDWITITKKTWAASSMQSNGSTQAPVASCSSTCSAVAAAALPSCASCASRPSAMRVSSSPAALLPPAEPPRQPPREARTFRSRTNLLPTQVGRGSPILADGRTRFTSPWKILSSASVVNFHVEVSYCSIGKKKKHETERKGKKRKEKKRKEKKRGDESTHIRWRASAALQTIGCAQRPPPCPDIGVAIQHTHAAPNTTQSSTFFARSGLFGRTARTVRTSPPSGLLQQIRASE